MPRLSIPSEELFYHKYLNKGILYNFSHKLKYNFLEAIHPFVPKLLLKELRKDIGEMYKYAKKSKDPRYAEGFLKYTKEVVKSLKSQCPKTYSFCNEFIYELEKYKMDKELIDKSLINVGFAKSAIFQYALPSLAVGSSLFISKALFKSMSINFSFTPKGLIKMPLILLNIIKNSETPIFSKIVALFALILFIFGVAYLSYKLFKFIKEKIFRK